MTGSLQRKGLRPSKRYRLPSSPSTVNLKCNLRFEKGASSRVPVAAAFVAMPSTVTLPLMSPTMLRELYFPGLKWCLEPLVAAGIGIIWHCDGDIRPILQDILDLGVQGLQGFEEEHGPRYEDMVDLRNRRGEKISVWGCVSVVTTFPHGTSSDVRAAVERSFELAGPGRGHVLSSTSSVLPETPQENIEAFFEHGKAFGNAFLGA